MADLEKIKKNRVLTHEAAVSLMQVDGRSIPKEMRDDVKHLKANAIDLDDRLREFVEAQ